MRHLEIQPKKIMASLLAVALLLPCYAPASEKEKEVRERPRVNFLISAPHRARTYSCNLLQHSFQCREYDIIPNAKNTLQDLRESCESMGGKFQPVDCPIVAKLSACTEIIRNLHKPDVIYKNLYYSGDKSHWDLESTRRVCTNLGGQWLPELSSKRPD